MSDVFPYTITHKGHVTSSEQPEWHCPNLDWCTFSRSRSVHYSATWFCQIYQSNQIMQVQIENPSHI